MTGLLLAATLAGPVRAADPWGRPEHLRAVAEPPADWADLAAARRRVRLWWDAGEAPGGGACAGTPRGDSPTRRAATRSLTKGSSAAISQPRRTGSPSPGPLPSMPTRASTITRSGTTTSPSAAMLPARS